MLEHFSKFAEFAERGLAEDVQSRRTQMTRPNGVTTNYTYGNTTTKVDSTGTTTYSWDFENRLTSATLPGTGGTVTFQYDPFGRRIYKSSSSGTTSIYAYDGQNLIEETNASGTVVARYSQTRTIDEPLAMLRSSATSYYQADGLGSITSLSSTAGSLTQTYIYDSFGRQVTSSGTITNLFQYTGRVLDAETGLYNYRARYYDVSTGRFLSEDPVPSPIHSNLYTYVRNSPPNRIDSSGMTDTPSGPQNPDPAHCHLVSTFSILSWTTSTRLPTSDWKFLMSSQAGPEGLDEPLGIPAAALTCVWERTYMNEIWGHKLNAYYWECWGRPFCGLPGKGFSSDVTFGTTTQFLGQSLGGIETTTTRTLFLGAEDETNDILCVTDRRLRPSP